MGGFVQGLGQGMQNVQSMQADIENRRQQAELFKLKSKQLKLETDMTEKQLAAQAALSGQLFRPPQQKEVQAQGPGAPQAPTDQAALLAGYSPGELEKAGGAQGVLSQYTTEGPQPTGMADIPGTGGPLAHVSPELQGVFQNILAATGGDMGKTMTTIQALAPGIFPQQPMIQKLGKDETLMQFDPRTGATRKLAQGSPGYHPPIPTGPGHVLKDPLTGQNIGEAVPPLEKPGKAKDNIMEVGGVAYEITEGEGGKKVLTPLPGQQPVEKEPKGITDENRVAREMGLKSAADATPEQMAQINSRILKDKVTVAAAQKEDAAGIALAKQKQELLSPTEANELGMPYGTTREQAKGQMAISPVQRATLAAFDSADVIISDIETYSKKVNTAEPGMIGRLSQTGKLWGALTQSDPDAAMLQSKAGELSQLARSLGEKGALANEDVARSAAMVPFATDTAPVAVQKIADMKKIISKGRENFMKSLGPGGQRAISPTVSAPPPPPQQQQAEDPRVSQLGSAGRAMYDMAATPEAKQRVLDAYFTSRERNGLNKKP